MSKIIEKINKEQLKKNRNGFGIGDTVCVHTIVKEGDKERIQKFTGTGAFVLQWGAFGAGPGRFVDLVGVAVDPDGNVYVTDISSVSVQQFTGEGVYLTGRNVAGYPSFVATDLAGNVYVVNDANHRVEKFTSTGTPVVQWGSFGSGDGQLWSPKGVAVDAAGSVYVVDNGNNRVEQFTVLGSFVSQWGGFGPNAGQFGNPRGVAVAAEGNVYIADGGQARIQKFGNIATPATTSTWGRLKAAYRE